MLEIIRMTIVVPYFLLVSFVALICACIRPFDSFGSTVMGRLVGFGSLKILNIDFELRGKENLYKERPVVFISNHQHNMDLFTIGNILPSRTVSIGKKALKWIPFFGQLYWLGGNILIDRSNRWRAIASMNKAYETMKEKNISIWIMPEGTRSKGRGILPFKKGAFHTAISSGRPLTIVCVSQYHKAINFNRWNTGKVIIEVLEPIPTDKLTKEDVKDLKDKCEKLMREKVAILDKEVEIKS
ncbi:1-acylglycerol-3-phosphate O-acyltransferase [Bacteriovoracaceae bacterium]|nr:1-acylglycerol-3-phosphate O-acyltransferase [Bacteriovoracaceae bacterium]